MMRLKRWWVGLIILVAIATIALAPAIGSRLSSPPSPNLSSPKIATTSASPPAAKIPANFFGMHIHHAEKTWPNVPFYSWRLWDSYTTWGDLEPQAGMWKFDKLDRAVAVAATKKVELLLTLGQTPRWASARPDDPSPYGNPGWPAEPANLQDWRNYIRTVATRYKGKIRHYEIWNEPDYKMFYTGSVSKMVELAREAYTILKQVDPQNVVLSPGATNGTPDFQWQKEFFAKGGGKYADVIAQHLYPKTAIPEERVEYIESFTKVVAAAGLSKKPIWNTETGWLKPVTMQSDRQAMAYVARTNLIDWAKGVQRLYWYAWDNRAAVSVYFTQTDRQTPTPIAKSYAQIQKWMVGARMTECKPQADKTWICQFARNGRSHWVVWNPDRQLTFTVPKNWNIKKTQDLTGKTTTLPASRQVSIDFSPLLLSSTTTP
jgi:Glycosyl hydrolase catalytic core